MRVIGRVSFLAVAGFLLGGCYTTVDEDYFEPAGNMTIFAGTSEAPKKIALVYFPTGARLQINDRLERGLTQIDLMLSLPPGTELQFAGRRAVFSSGSQREECELAWKGWVYDGKHGHRTSVPFDARLTSEIPAHVTGKRRETYRETFLCAIPFPAVLQQATHFTLDLPGAIDAKPVHVEFTRKHVHYRFLNTQPIQ